MNLVHMLKSGAIVLATLMLSSLAFAAPTENVTISAAVGVPAPVITSVQPETPIILVNAGGSRNVNFTVSNPNGAATITWTATVTSGSGVVGPMNGSIDTATASNDSFDFLAPAGSGPAVVTLTLNDGTAVSLRTLDFFYF